RSATFRARRGKNAYDEDSVDAFLARAVDVLLGVE
ncbi:MAG: DivIVA domain-containing protein, partial [Micrococcales bacterium]|nr:DivIVA domain-containing protein [Micrococcales bacterium]